MTELPLGSDFKSAAELPLPGPVKPVDGPALRSDLRRLQSQLLAGDDSVARRKDIGELHKRVVALVTTLDQGLSEKSAAKAAEDRAAIDARLGAMEKAVNSIDGALRIELAPLLKAMVIDAVQVHAQQKSDIASGRRILIAALCGLGFGFLASQIALHGFGIDVLTNSLMVFE